MPSAGLIAANGQQTPSRFCRDELYASRLQYAAGLCAQATHRRAASRQLLAGDAVLIAPVSGQIPCQQGILQGKPRFRDSSDQFSGMNRLCRIDFTRNSLR